MSRTFKGWTIEEEPRSCVAKKKDHKPIRKANMNAVLLEISRIEAEEKEKREKQRHVDKLLAGGSEPVCACCGKPITTKMLTTGDFIDSVSKACGRHLWLHKACFRKEYAGGVKRNERTA